MAAHEALRHEPAVGRAEHVRRANALGVQDTRQPVEELRRGRHVSITWGDDPVAVLESYNPGETGLSDHRPARQEQERFITLAAGNVVPANPGDGDVLERVCSPEL